MMNAFTDGATPVEMIATQDSLTINAKLGVDDLLNSTGSSAFDYVRSLEQRVNDLSAQVILLNQRLDEGCGPST